LRLQVINETHLPQHHYLTSDDSCYFLGELSPGLDNWTYIKSLIHNLKKKPTDVGYVPYKEQSILQTISLFENLIISTSIESLTIVPIPPSKSKNHPEYDDRIWKILEGLKLKLENKFKLDIRKLVYQSESYIASHTTLNRISLEELLSIYKIDEEYAFPEPNFIFLVDDVLTSGCHYKAMKSILNRRFPNTKLAAIFLARRQIN
jgi:predicted amidophosphoribosyltransferase